MRKKSLTLLILVFVLMTHSVFATTQTTFLEERLTQGLLSVKGSFDSSAMKLMVQKEDQKYYYSLQGENTDIPLQLGDGDYQFFVLEPLAGSRYRVVDKKTIQVTLDQDAQVFLQSAQPVSWSEEMKAILWANQLLDGVEGDEEKIEVLYKAVSDLLDYDYEKINRVSSDYVPEIDKVLAEGKGICYDYSALLGAMLRSQGIPAKLVKGYRQGMDVYHAWNEVYLKDRDQWVIIDATYDDTAGGLMDLYKDASLYQKVREY